MGLERNTTNQLKHIELQFEIGFTDVEAHMRYVAKRVLRIATRLMWMSGALSSPRAGRNSLMRKLAKQQGVETPRLAERLDRRTQAGS